MMVSELIGSSNSAVLLLAQCLLIAVGVVAYTVREFGKAKVEKENGGKSPMSMLTDLHDWHKPVINPKSGSMEFRWFHEHGVIEELKKLNIVQCESLVEIKAMRVDAERQTNEIMDGYRRMKEEAVAEVFAKIEEKCR